MSWVYWRMNKMSSFEEELEKAKYTLLQDISTIKEIFIIDELKSYMDLSDTTNPKWVQPVRVRLQEKKDWESKVVQAICECEEELKDYKGATRLAGRLLKKLGLEDE